MARSIKPTLIVLTVMALPFIVVAGLILYQSDASTFVNTILALLLVLVVILIIMVVNKFRDTKTDIPGANQINEKNKK